MNQGDGAEVAIITDRLFMALATGWLLFSQTWISHLIVRTPLGAFHAQNFNGRNTGKMTG
jgi:hypothetical protein